MSDRKRNRWGESTAAAPPTVSEDEVVKALLSEAELRQREKERQRPPKQRKGVDRGRDERGHRDGRGDGDRGSHVDRQGLRENDSYYGPSEGQRSQLDMAKEPADEGEIVEKQKPNFGISGALAKDDEKGNVYIQGSRIEIFGTTRGTGTEYPLEIACLQRRGGSGDASHIKAVGVLVRTQRRHSRCSSSSCIVQLAACGSPISIPSKQRNWQVAVLSVSDGSRVYEWILYQRGQD